MIILVKNKHSLQIDDFEFKCSIGKKGSTKNKKEGDKKTPKGIFAIENLYFRKDRIKKPITSLKCMEIKKNMGWCDDINFPKNYNKLIKVNNRLAYLRKSVESGDGILTKGSIKVFTELKDELSNYLMRLNLLYDESTKYL